MATILEFKASSGHARNNTNVRGEAVACQVVIFPGVRVAYWDDVFNESDKAQPPAAKKSRKPAKQKRR